MTRAAGRSRRVGLALGALLLATHAAGDTVPSFAPRPVFIENRGQLGATDVVYYVQSGPVTSFFTANGVVYDLPGEPTSESERRSGAVASGESRTRARVAIRSSFVGGRRASPRALDESADSARLTFLVGADPGKWAKGVKGHDAIVYREVWPGIDVVYRTTDKGIKYDLIVAPGAEPTHARFRYEGADSLQVDASGALKLVASGTSIVEDAPRTYQKIDGRETEIPSRFVTRGGLVYGFEIGPYDRTRPLVIDPEIDWGTYLGGSGNDIAFKIKRDANGDLLVAGDTESPDFPTMLGAYDSGTREADDQNGFVSKLSADGSRLIWSTILGGTRFPLDTTRCTTRWVPSDEPGAEELRILGVGGYEEETTCSDARGGKPAADGIRGLSVDADGNVYVAGYTEAEDFPTTAGVFQRSHGGGAGAGAGAPAGYENNPSGTGYDYFDAFVAKLDPNGEELIFSTYFGGTADDSAWCVYSDAYGNVYIGGMTGNRGGLPITADAIQPEYAGGETDGWLAKLDAHGARLVWSTYLGGPGTDEVLEMAPDGHHNLYVVGTIGQPDYARSFFTQDARLRDEDFDHADPFVAKVCYWGKRLYVTRLPGWSARGIARGDDGSLYVVGLAHNLYELRLNRVPEDIYYFDAEVSRWSGSVSVVKLTADGSSLVYGTYFAGNAKYLRPFDIDVDGTGSVYVGGYDDGSQEFPETSGALPRSVASEGFLLVLDPGGGLIYGSHVGGDHQDSVYGVDLDDTGGVYLAGYTTSQAFPVTAGAFQTSHGGGEGYLPLDGFVLRMSRLRLESSAPLAPLEPEGKGPRAVQALKGSLWSHTDCSANCGFDGPITPHLWWEDERVLRAAPPPNEAGMDEGFEWLASFDDVAAPGGETTSLEVFFRGSYESFGWIEPVQVLSLWNTWTGVWDVIDSRTFPHGSTREFVITVGDARDYVDPDGTVRLKVSEPAGGMGDYDFLRVNVP